VVINDEDGSLVKDSKSSAKVYQAQVQTENSNDKNCCVKQYEESKWVSKEYMLLRCHVQMF